MNIQNTLRNIHITGGSTNTLLRIPYYCADGLEITNNLPVNREDVIEQDGATFKNAIQKTIVELVDKSLGIQLQ